MASCKIYAPQISTYGRICATIAHEAGVDWTIIATDATHPDHRRRHPFQKSPAVEIDGVEMFESIAIAQYLDEVYNNGKLQPADPLNRARMAQWISIANSYVFPTSEFGLVMPRLIVPMMGGTPDESLIERALPTIAYQMSVVSNRCEEVRCLAGEHESLADIFMYCVLRAVQLTEEGAMIIDRLLPLKWWMENLEHRPSIIATRWPAEAGA